MSSIYRVLLATAKQFVTKTCQAARHASDMCVGNIGCLCVNVNHEKWFLVSREEIYTHAHERVIHIVDIKYGVPINVVRELTRHTTGSSDLFSEGGLRV